MAHEMVKKDGAGDLVQAAEGRITWTSSKALRPLGIAGVSGGLFVAIARWQAGKWFKKPDGTDDVGAKWKRGAAVAVLGLGAAMLVKRWSVAAAVGIAVFAVGYGALEVLDDPDGAFHISQRLTTWSNRSTTTPTTTTTTTTNPPAQGVRGKWSGSGQVQADRWGFQSR